MLRLKTTFIMLALWGSVHAQTNTDSMTIRKTVLDFYTWYSSIIKTSETQQYSPEFSEDKNGKTTLAFDEYFQNLRNYSFSESFILKEKESYQVCIDNLKEIDYSKLDSTLTDLSDFEEIECDFFNYYKLLGTMDRMDGVEIKNVKITNDKATVSIQYFTIESDNSVYLWNNNTNVELLKNNSRWEINAIR